ncbi:MULTISPECIES: hypothetical protein [unclassified Thermosynechococcus]|nr:MULTISPECIES: hypothetical protein [unclassified Thermosynechococcus]WKT82450.1 hypothetical protein QYC27_06510 [Thermosynechococcus sp. PP45]WNC28718.1 hypothetical protein RHH53_06520 [Thermosynechococcus sp. PKX82]
MRTTKQFLGRSFLNNLAIGKKDDAARDFTGKKTVMLTKQILRIAYWLG